MKCSKCQFDNRKGAKYCLQCGDIIDLRCLQCNTSLPFAANYCDYCGEKLGDPSKDEKMISAPEGERKRVAVLFSDMSGYMAMMERLDPEEVKEIMVRVFAEITRVISRYDGFPEKFIGDAIMAISEKQKTEEGLIIFIVDIPDELVQAKYYFRRLLC